jgi:two-component system LytT family response regulator
MITAGIIDDEIKVADGLKKIIEKYLARKIRVLFVANSIAEAISEINHHHPDMVFLDVEMPHENGFDLFKHYPNPEFKVVFTTAYKEYAIKAIKYSALDYLLKPINHVELLELIQKFENQAKKPEYRFQLETLVTNLNNTSEAFPKIALPTQTGFEFIKTNNIVYCKAENNYTTISTSLNETILVTKTLKAIEEMLPENIFLRIHKSYLVNSNYVKAFSRNGGQGVVLENGLLLPVSGSKTKEILAFLTKG